MGIHEIGPRTLRNTIGFFDEDPPQSNEEKEWLGSFVLTRISATDVDDPARLIGLAAVIFRQRAENPYRIARNPKRLSMLLAAGVPVFINPAEVEPGKQTPILRQSLVDALDGASLPVSKGGSAREPVFTPAIHLLGETDAWQEVAEYIQKYPLGPPPNLALNPTVYDVRNVERDLESEDVVILRRAFWNCSKLTLMENQEGRSGVSTFRAFAALAGDTVGTSRPFEYFVKVGNRDQIAKEYRAYNLSALEHIPYHLGPRLRLDRCALGASRGIIVCDYVNGAEKLRDCAKDGRAVPIIANLFNTTLRNWLDNMTPIDVPLSEFLTDRMPKKIPKRRQAKIRKLGRTHTAKELSDLVQSMASAPILAGSIHGDLHALNVLVRGGDAIVIDFEKAEDRAPLLRDLAALESGLFVDGFIGVSRSGTDLLRSVDCLYTGTALLNGRFDLCHPSDGSAWFFDCVRQIRMHAPQIERAPGQYALSLAVEFAKKACKDDDFTGHRALRGELTGEDVRACAYILAQRILTELADISGEVAPA